ncbi:bifunctional DNA-binding transcriptional regulator/O6-methylguanine-DNA methyltransferase Ada [Humitalea sp. 24SJ18S-53]|uniref:bifunctional DNA-binding transcriptional regulator/O6-methylguanine-DNA methyltransferase Ada n=1 Tax=Humitalea sp. 24SJ18S-53 TaxID=3422307 RepID=UPI003D679584
MSAMLASPFASDADRWEAVIRRDPAADGAFWYSVRTTGVYCRPSCAARQALRQNVAFHASPAAAEAAGFRPCKRCRPTEAPLAERQAEVVAGACRAIEHALETGDPLPSLDDLAAASGFSRFHFHRMFRAVAGVTPRAYVASLRAGRVRAGLAEGARVTTTLYDAGFNASSRFYAASTGMLGMRPAEYRDGGRGTRIRFAIGECSLGSILVAATERGVCAIQFGDDAAALLAELQGRFPKAELIGADPDFDATVAQVIAMVETPQAAKTLPLDLRGTAFQQRVWQALAAIPSGRTATYTEIANAIGLPRAVRAVAAACAANPTAVAIPCHRVVRLDGNLAGYRWGLERKRELLARERAA